MTQLTDKVYAIPMPKGAESCELRGAHFGRPYPLLSFYGEGEAVELPPGEYQIVVFNTKTATEEQARKVVDRYGKGWKDYNMYHADKHIPYELAIDSFETLLRSKGLDDKNYALIEKLK